MTARASHGAEAHAEHGGLTVRSAVGVWGALMALLVLTVAAAFVPLGPFNVVAALLIAIAKALLVAVFFMHLRWSSPVARIFAAAGVLWLLIMISLTLGDVLTRTPGTVPGHADPVIAARQLQPGAEPHEPGHNPAPAP